MELIEEDRITKMQPKLRSLPAKEEKRKALLPRLVSLFEPNKEYSEEEVKKLIRPIYSDDAIIRRYLVDYGYLNRSSDGSKYYRNSEGEAVKNMNKKELINEYKQREIEMGIIKIHNNITGYSYIDVCNDLYKPFEGIKFRLGLGRVKVKSFQEEWNKYGENAFTFEIVERLDSKKEDSEEQKSDDLNELLKLWLESNSEGLKLYQ